MQYFRGVISLLYQDLFQMMTAATCDSEQESLELLYSQVSVVMVGFIFIFV